MNVLIVDTSSWISYFDGKPNSKLDLALQEGRVFIPALVIAELTSARLRPKEKEKLISFLKELPPCEISFEHWVKVGELRALVAQKGISLSTPDAHIAQCALDLEGYLLSEDLVFKKIAPLVHLKLI